MNTVRDFCKSVQNPTGRKGRHYANINYLVGEVLYSEIGYQYRRLDAGLYMTWVKKGTKKEKELIEHGYEIIPEDILNKPYNGKLFGR